MTYGEAVSELLRHCNSKLNVFKKYHSGWYGVEKCTKCGKSKSKRINMYILFPDELEPDRPVSVKCFRASCGHSGKISEEDMAALGFRNKECISVIVNHKAGNSMAKLPRVSDGINIYTNYVRNLDTMAYFKARTRINLDSQAASEYHIIMDYRDLLKNNPLIPPNCAESIYRVINRTNLICFVTSTGKRLIVRSLRGSFKCILPLVDGVNSDYYILRRDYGDLENVVVAEGTFDIINFANMNRELTNSVFIATLGIGSTYDAINYETLDYDVLDRLIIVADSERDKHGRYDIDYRRYKRLADSLSDRFKEIYVVYNSASKDFGDLREPISPKKIRLK